MSSTLHYAIKDRDGKITQEPGKKDAKRDQKAFGGLIVRSKGEGEYKPYKPRKVFLWVFLAIQATFIIWLIAGTASTGGGIHASVVAQCHTKAAGMGMTQAQCVSFLGGAGKVGTSIGAALIIVVWVIVDFLVGLTYGIYRLVRR
jgi:hypothetical protein